MIQPLRKIHRGIFLALLLILPVLFVSGLLSRHEWPVPGSALSEGSMLANKMVSGQTALMAGRKFHVRFAGDPEGKTGGELQLVPESPLVAPDVLVYWSKTDASSEFPAGAALLGGFSPTKHYRLPMPEIQGKGQGFIVLYSLAQKQTLGSFAIGQGGGRP